MLARCLIVVGLTAALSIFSGCAQKKTVLDSHWGKSFESATSNQILNPEADKNLAPVVGLDGQAAEIVMETYRKDFGGKALKKSYNLNLGSIDSIGNK
jgi:hypothetical protein